MQRPVPSFRLVSPPPPPPRQLALFCARGQPQLSLTESEALRTPITHLLAVAKVPDRWIGAFAAWLRDGMMPPPDAVDWLCRLAHARRWQQALSCLGSLGDAARPVRERALHLLQYARALRQWPRRARKGIAAHRSRRGGFDIAVLPPIPQTLRPHAAALVAVGMETVGHVYEALALPVRCQRQGSVRTIEVLRCFRLHFDFARHEIGLDFMQASGWTVQRGATADLVEPIPTDAWCSHHATLLHSALRQRLDDAWTTPAVAETAQHWLTALVRDCAQRSGVLTHVRAELRAAYPVDAQVIADLHACSLARTGISCWRYAWGWRHAAVLRRRVSDAPRLAPLWALAMHCQLARLDDDYDRLKAVAQQHGVTESGWRLLCHHSRRLCAPIARLSWRQNREVHGLFGYVRILQQAQCTQPLPFDLAVALLTGHWFTIELPRDLPIGFVRGAIARRAQYLIEGRTSTRFIEDEFVPALGWLMRAQPVLDAQQRRAPWSWFLRRYHAWDERERRVREGRRWTHGLDAMSLRGCDVVPLRDSVTLWSEGERMRTCISRYETECAQGSYVIYSVRPWGAPRAVAHVGVCIDAVGVATLDQVRGFANRAVEPVLAACADDVVARHNAGRAVSPGLPLATPMEHR